MSPKQCLSKRIPLLQTEQDSEPTGSSDSHTQRQWKISALPSNGLARYSAGRMRKQRESSLGENELESVAVSDLKLDAIVDTADRAFDNVGAGGH